MDHVLKFAIGLRHMIVFREYVRSRCFSKVGTDLKHDDRDLELNSLITDGRYLHVALYCWLDNHDSTLDTHVIDILSQLNLRISSAIIGNQTGRIEFFKTSTCSRAVVGMPWGLCVKNVAMFCNGPAKMSGALAEKDSVTIVVVLMQVETYHRAT